MTRTATAKEVRKHYKDDGYDVRISRDGHVTYRDPDRNIWCEGRWVEEYRVEDDGSVRHA